MQPLSLIILSISTTLSVASIVASIYTLTAHQRVPAVSALEHRIGQLEMQLSDQFESTQRLIRRFSARAARDAKVSANSDAGEDISGDAIPQIPLDFNHRDKAALRAAARARGFRV